MTKLKQLLRRLDAYTLETFNPPHAQWHTQRALSAHQALQQTTKPQAKAWGFVVVREGGVEPPRPFGHTDLNRARLPVPPLAREAGQG